MAEQSSHVPLSSISIAISYARPVHVWSSSISLDRRVVTKRIEARSGHFMPTSLIDSQYATLEPLTTDEVGITLNFDASREELTTKAATWLTDID